MDYQQHRPNLLDVPISYFEYDRERDSFANVPAGVATLRRIAGTKQYRALIETIRAESDKTVQDELKKQLPAITPVALLHHRKRDTSFAEKIRQQWPVMMGDIDKKDNPGVDMAELKTHIARLRYVLLCAYSVRGGLWFVVRLPDDQTPDTLAAHFRYLQKRFTIDFGVHLDVTKGGNPTHLRFVSYDAAPYINENATVMVKTYTPPKPKPKADRSRPGRQRGCSGPDEGELLTRLVRFTEAATEGNRHMTLLKAATTAGGLIAAGRVDEQTVVYALETVASEWPTFAKSQKTIRDGIRYGLQNPLYPDTSHERHGDTGAKTDRTPPTPAVTQTSQTPPTAPINWPTNLPEKPVDAPAYVRTIAEWAANPGAILRPDESQIERLIVEYDEQPLPESVSVLDRMIAKNPALNLLIDALDLVEI